MPHLDIKFLIQNLCINSFPIDKVKNLIGQGFGRSSHALGIIAIVDVPNFADLRKKLLFLSHRLATRTPQVVLDKMTNEKSHYQVGWSHGKEKLEGGKLDTLKGSFYANPLTDNPLDDIIARDYAENQTGTTPLEKHDFCKLAQENPAFYAPNIWPDEDIPELRSYFQEMGRLIHFIGCMVGKHADAHVSSECPGYEPLVEKTIANSL